jgi:hypothetical protein
MKNTARATGVEGRIVNLSSIAHSYTYEHGIRFDKISERTGYALFFFSSFRGRLLFSFFGKLIFKIIIKFRMNYY